MTKELQAWIVEQRRIVSSSCSRKKLHYAIRVIIDQDRTITDLRKEYSNGKGQE